MKFFKGFAVLLALTFILLGILFLYDSVSHPIAAAPGQIIAGAFFCSLALTLVYFLLRPAEK